MEYWKNNKKSQITLFVILGFVIILAFVLLFTFKIIQFGKKGIVVEHTDIKALRLYTDTCLKMSLDDVLFRIGLNGGYITPKDNFNYEGLTISYMLPTKEIEEKEIENGIKNSLPSCINDFEDFKKAGLKITPEHITAETLLADRKTSLNKRDISIKVLMPITVKQDGKETDLGAFAQSADVRLKAILGYLQNIQSNDINLTYLNSLDVNTTIIEKEGVNIFFITDPFSNLNGKDYRFATAVKKT